VAIQVLQLKLRLRPVEVGCRILVSSPLVAAVSGLTFRVSGIFSQFQELSGVSGTFRVSGIFSQFQELSGVSGNFQGFKNFHPISGFSFPFYIYMLAGVGETQ
jgi:hypothetical protein